MSSCPNCSRSVDPMARECPHCRVPFVIPEVAVAPPAITESPARKRPLARYVDRCGLPSFIAQIVLACWSVILGGFLLLVLAACAHAADTGTPYHQTTATAAGMFFLISVTWAFIAVPLGIVAAVTFGSGRQQSSRQSFSSQHPSPAQLPGLR